MTDSKNTEDQELSLDQLKDAAGGISTAGSGGVAGHTKPLGSFAPNPKENLEPEAGDDVLKKNAESLRSDNRF